MPDTVIDSSPKPAQVTIPDQSLAVVEDRIAHMESKKSDLLQQMNSIVTQAEARNEGNRELTRDEKIELKDLRTALEDVEDQLAIQRDLQSRNTEASEPQPRKAMSVDVGREDVGSVNEQRKEPELTPAMSRRVSRPTLLNSPTHTFMSMGEFSHAVARAALNKGVDHRLVANIQQEQVGSDGGFTVPPQYADEIYRILWGAEVATLAPFCRQLPMTSNTITLPSTMDTPYDDSGIAAYWGVESSTHRQSTANFETVTLTLNKLTSLVKITDELMEDQLAMDAYIRTAAAQAIGWKIADSIVDGSGVGRPRGFLSADCLVTVQKESSQAAGTILALNIAKMWSRMPPSSQASAIWMVSPSAFPQLQNLSIADQPVLLPAGGMAGRPVNTIFMRPVYTHGAMESLGSEGDIALVDLNQYYWASKYAGIKSATSIHMDFDKDIVAFKFQMRVDGRPIWSKAVTQPKGSETWSPFVTLADRS